MDWIFRVSFRPHSGTATTPSALATAACPVLVFMTVAKGTGSPLLVTFISCVVAGFTVLETAVFAAACSLLGDVDGC